MAECAKYYDYRASVADIEALMNVSHRTAERLMHKLKKDLEIRRYAKPTMEQVLEYFKVENKIR